MRGRKRNLVAAREPNGRAQRPGSADRLPPLAHKRRELAQAIGLPEQTPAQLMDAAFGTPIGLLHKADPKGFPAPLFQAAQRFASFQGWYDRLSGFPSRSTRSPDYALGLSRGAWAGGGTLEEFGGAERLAAAAHECVRIRLALGERDYVRVYNAAMLAQPIIPTEAGDLRAALGKLAVFYGMMPPPAARAA